MSNWLTSLRKKPKHVRDNIAFAMSGGVTVCVLATVWLLGGIGPHTIAKTEEAGPGIFKTFFGEFGKQVATIKETLPDKKEPPAPIAESFPEAGPGAVTSTATNGWETASTSVSTVPPQRIMIVTTSSTPATTSTSQE
jgi:hypothetical protein